MKAIAKYMKERGLSQKEFGRQVGVNQSMVSQWLTGTRPLSPKKAIQINKRTAIPRHELRPDLWQKEERAA